MKGRFTQEEIQFIEENCSRLTKKRIAEKLNRSYESVKDKMIAMGFTNALLREGLTSYEIHKLTGIPIGTLSHASHQGLIKSTRSKFNNDSFEYSLEDLREYIFRSKFHRRKEFYCLECQKTVLGDIYCASCLPIYMRSKPQVRDVYRFNLSSDCIEEMREAIALIIDTYREVPA